MLQVPLEMPESSRYRIFWKDVRAGFGLRVERTGPTSFSLKFKKRKAGDRRVTLGQHGMLVVHLLPEHEVDVAVFSRKGELLYSTVSGTPKEVRERLAVGDGEAADERRVTPDDGAEGS